MAKGTISIDEKYSAAKNALVAKYTFESLDRLARQKVDNQVMELLVSAGISSLNALPYKMLLRETQYFGVAALAMAIIGVRPALKDILPGDRWESIRNPLIALRDAEKAIEMAENDILTKHGVLVAIADSDKRYCIRTLKGVEPCRTNLN